MNRPTFAFHIRLDTPPPGCWSPWPGNPHHPLLTEFLQLPGWGYGQRRYRSAMIQRNHNFSTADVGHKPVEVFHKQVSLIGCFADIGDGSTKLIGIDSSFSSFHKPMLLLIRLTVTFSSPAIYAISLFVFTERIEHFIRTNRFLDTSKIPFFTQVPQAGVVPEWYWPLCFQRCLPFRWSIQWHFFRMIVFIFFSISIVTSIVVSFSMFTLLRCRLQCRNGHYYPKQVLHIIEPGHVVHN